MHHLSIITLLEPFSYSINVQNFKIKLAIENTASNYNGKILVFCNGDVDNIISDEDAQKITYDFNHNEVKNKFTTTFVYAKCKYHLRRPLWDKLLQQDSGN